MAFTLLIGCAPIQNISPSAVVHAPSLSEINWRLGEVPDTDLPALMEITIGGRIDMERFVNDLLLAGCRVDSCRGSNPANGSADVVIPKTGFPPLAYDFSRMTDDSTLILTKVTEGHRRLNITIRKQRRDGFRFIGIDSMQTPSGRINVDYGRMAQIAVDGKECWGARVAIEAF